MVLILSVFKFKLNRNLSLENQHLELIIPLTKMEVEQIVAEHLVLIWQMSNDK